MPRYSKTFRREWEFFINPATDNITFNEQCKGCTQDCKQSYRSEIVQCPHYEKAEQEQEAEK